jgi:hypothetical protein
MRVVRATSRGIFILTKTPLEYTNTKTMKKRDFKFTDSSSVGAISTDEG